MIIHAAWRQGLSPEAGNTHRKYRLDAGCDGQVSHDGVCGPEEQRVNTG